MHKVYCGYHFIISLVIEDNFAVTTVDFVVEFLHVHLIDSCCINKVFAIFIICFAIV
jgi:hypothetical protein